ncbi:T9SS type A sorting domain-containing protein [bacterium]|nr:T9SS type A sorting domain-containing protein [bacterium]
MKLLRITQLAVILCFAAQVLASPDPVRVNMQSRLEPFKQYYDSQDQWPRAHGYKPYMRYQWDVMQRSFDGGEVPAGALWEGYQAMQRMPKVALDEPWTPLGPFNHGGRTRVVRFHPNNSNIMFAGSVGGGLFRSDNAGELWYPISDALPNLAIGCFEISQSNPNVMYLGTGEGYFNGDAIAGVGLFKSIDGGVTWNLTALDYNYSEGQSVLKISIDPRNEDIVLASTTGGMYRSLDGGANWTMVRTGHINELKRDPQNPDILLCGHGNPWGSGSNGIYRSEDNGATWTGSSTGLPSSTNIGRIVFDFYRNNSQVVYAGICGTFTYNGSEMMGIYRSVDGGLNWAQMSQAGQNHYASQGWYDMAIAVDSDESNTVYSAGLDIYRSTNSGFHWSQRTFWWYSYGHERFSHADHHELVMHPTDGDQVWAVNDGGIFVSYDNGETWNEKNNGFNTFQYYAMGNATLDTALAYGGTQDNGTSRYDGDGIWDEVFGGDGGYCVVDYSNNDVVYVEWQNGHRYRSDDGAVTFSEINPGIDGDGPWVTPIVQDPFDPLTIYTTTNGSVWKSPNQGRNGDWINLGPIGSSNQVLAASPALPGRLYLGNGSSVLRYDEEDGTWVNVTGNLPGSYTTRVVPDPYDPNTVYVTKSGFDGQNIWKSVQSGTIWTNISGNLPHVPFQDVVVDLTAPSTLYAGSDLGVFFTEDGGANWAILGEGMPILRVDDMELQSLTGTLRIGTHARGMWEIATGSAGMAMLYPNGTEILPIGSEITLRWSGITSGGHVSLEMNRDYPSANWEVITENTLNDGNELWTVAGPVSDHARFRVTHTTMPELADTSNADTRIAQPSLALVYPNGGETVFSGVNDTIRFARTLVEGPLSIYLNRNYPSGAWEEVVLNHMGLDNYLWRVQLPGGEHCRVRIVSGVQQDVMVESATDFVMLAPQMELNAPNGGETVTVGTPSEVLWNAPEHHGAFRIQLNRAYPSGAWETISPNTANDGSYTWTPTGAASTTARVRLAALLDPLSTYVESAQNFTILGGTAADIPEIPSEFRVSEVYPNPFNPSTSFTMNLPTTMRIQIVVTNQLGQMVATLEDGVLPAGVHRFRFDGSGFASGIYFLRIHADAKTEIRKLTLMK